MEAISLRMRDFDNRMSAATKPKITMNTTATIEYWTVRRRTSRITGKFCQITFISLVLFRCFDIYNNIHLKKRAAQQSARSEEHTSELQSLMRISYAVFCLKKK